jgi:hypothetical protein
MLGVDQAVILVRSKNRRHEQKTVFSSLDEFAPDPGKLRRCRRITPICRKLGDFNPLLG